MPNKEAESELEISDQALINDGPKFTSEMSEQEGYISLDRLWGTE